MEDASDEDASAGWAAPESSVDTGESVSVPAQERKTPATATTDPNALAMAVAYADPTRTLSPTAAGDLAKTARSGGVAG
jgi:hypothetical protein